MLRARHLLETCLYADDLDAAERFYAGVIGLDVVGRVDGRHVFFRCGDAQFLVFNPAATIQPGDLPPHGTAGHGHVAFVLEPGQLNAWRDQLTSHGTPIELDYAWPNGGRSLYFRDPAGNSVELATRRVWTPDAQNVTEP